MKTATVTWINHDNYGTYLQAYALQQTIKKNGFENKIIDDSFIVNKKSEPIKKTKVQAFIMFLRQSAYNILHFKKVYLGKKLLKILDKKAVDFSKFKEQFLDMDYSFEPTTMKTKEKYDIFICGSDQIWAPDKKIFNPYYYLNFVQKPSKKVSYAPSIGYNSIDREYKEKISEYLKSFDYISVRETQGKSFLQKLTDKNVQTVLDPTFLLTKEEWENIAVDTNEFVSEKYVLCYFLGFKKWYIKCIRHFAEILNCKTVIVPTSISELEHKFDYCYKGGPQGFVSLIKNAEFVVTDSFHGTIFSIIFNKQFISLKRFKDSDANCQNSRLVNIMEKFGLEKNLIDENSALDNLKIKYNDVNNRLNIERKKSIEWLLLALRGEKNDL